MTAISLSQIDVPERLRPTDGDYVSALADSMARIGQTEPILVRPITADGFEVRFELVAGAHRLAAAAELGWETIEAMARDMDALTARLAEIDERLSGFPRAWSAIDRAIFLAEVKETYLRIHPETVRGRPRKSKNFKDRNQTENLRNARPALTTKEEYGGRPIERLESIRRSVRSTLKAEPVRMSDVRRRPNRGGRS